MVGTLINCGAIILGTVIGLLVGKRMKKSVSDTVMQGVGLCVIIIGLQGALATKNIMLMIISVAVGGALGAMLNIDGQMQKMGAFAQRKLMKNAKENDTFAQGFVMASLVFCVGAMAVVGALDSGIRGDHSTLIAKSVLDGIASIVFASSFGIGVMLSVVPIFIYQGSIALLGTVIAPYLSDVLVHEMSAVGSLLIMAIGMNMALSKDIKIANFLPSILIPCLYYTFVG